MVRSLAKPKCRECGTKKREDFGRSYLSNGMCRKCTNERYRTWAKDVKKNGRRGQRSDESVPAHILAREEALSPPPRLNRHANHNVVSRGAGQEYCYTCNETIYRGYQPA